MDISAIAVQTTPTDPATLLGEDTASAAHGGFAALLALSARQLGQAGLQSLSVNNMAMMQNIQIAPPPPPPPMPAAQAEPSPPPAPSASAPPADNAPDPSQPAPQSVQSQQADTRPAEASDNSQSSDQRADRPAAQDSSATNHAASPSTTDQTAKNDDTAKGQQPSPTTTVSSTGAPQQTAQTTTSTQGVNPATDNQINDPTLLADAAMQAAPTPGPAAPAAGTGASVKASPTAGDGKSATAAKNTTAGQDDMTALAAASMVAPPPVAPVAAPSANSAAPGISGLAMAGAAANAPGADNAGAAGGDGIPADPHLLAGHTPAALHATPTATQQAAAAAQAAANAKAQTASSGQPGADSAAFDPTNGASTQNTATPTNQAAALQAQKLSQLAGQTGVTITAAPPPATQGLPAQSVSALAPGAALFDPSVQTGSSGDGKASGGFSGDTSQQPANQSAPVAGTMLFSLTPLSTLTAAAQVTAAAQAAAQGATQTIGANAGSPADVSARLTAPILTEAAGPVAATPASLPQTASLASPTGMAVPASSAADDAAPTAPTTQASQPEEPAPLDQLKVQIDKGIKSGNDTISVQLRPDDLGRVDVKLEVQNGEVKATVTADKPETLQLLKNDAPVLQQALHDAGLNADSTALSFQLRGEQQQGQRQTGQNSGRGSRRAQDISLSADDSVSATAMNTARSRQQSAGGVDINV